MQRLKAKMGHGGEGWGGHREQRLVEAFRRSKRSRKRNWEEQWTHFRQK